MAYRSSFSAIGTAGSGSGGHDGVVLTKPSGVIAGDWLLFVVMDGDTPVIWPFTPADTEVASVDGGETMAYGMTAALYQAGSSEPADYAITVQSGGINPRALVVAFSGRSGSVPTITPYSDFNDGASPRTVNLSTGATAAAGDDLAFVLGGVSGTTAASWSLTDPTNFTAREQANGVSSFSYGPLKLWTRDNHPGSSIANIDYTATLSSTQLEQMGFLVQFAEDGGGGSSTVLKVIQQASVTESEKHIHHVGMAAAMGALAVREIKTRRHFLMGAAALGINGVVK